MGERIAEMIPNGATIQLGIGGVPNAVAGSLMNHRDLGIHTEMFVDSMVDLIEAGVANGSRKTFHPGKAVYSFAAGSSRMYEFLDDNPHIEAHPVSYVNFPANIARNRDMISVNSTIEIDLTGQCCSESMGTTQFSGTGEQLPSAPEKNERTSPWLAMCLSTAFPLMLMISDFCFTGGLSEKCNFPLASRHLQAVAA